MYKFFVGLVFALFATVSFAQTVDVSKLTPEQRIVIQQQALELQKQRTSSGTVAVEVRKEAEAWGQLGQNLGIALIAAAKELGVAANEFATTPLGMVVSFIVIYKLIGGSMLGILFGVFSMAFGIWFALYVNRRLCYDFEYEYKPVLWGMFNRRKVTKRTRVNGESYFMGWALTLLAIAVSWVVGLNLIF
jgi:hypothetical protein